MAVNLKAERERIERMKKDEGVDDDIHAFSISRKSTVCLEDVYQDANPFVSALLARFNLTQSVKQGVPPKGESGDTSGARKPA